MPHSGRTSKHLWIGWRGATLCIAFALTMTLGGAWLLEGFHARTNWGHLDKVTAVREGGVLGGMQSHDIRAELDWPAPAPPGWLEPDILIYGHGFGYYRANAGRDYNGIAVRKSGWPMLAMQTEAASEGNSPIDRGWGARGYRVGSAHLPLRPIWAGLIVDLALWTALPWAIFAGLSAARVRRRMSRGLCVRCRYDIHGLETCPECGSPAAATTAPPVRRGDHGASPHTPR